MDDKKRRKEIGWGSQLTKKIINFLLKEVKYGKYFLFLDI